MTKDNMAMNIWACVMSVTNKPTWFTKKACDNSTTKYTNTERTVERLEALKLEAHGNPADAIVYAVNSKLNEAIKIVRGE